MARLRVSGIGEAGDLMMEISISTPMPDEKASGEDRVQIIRIDSNA
jgi:hypothetical protein